MRRARDLVARLLRVTTYALVVSGGLGVVGARQVHAKARESAALIGEELLRLSESDPGAARELSINGQSIHITSAQTSLSLAAVLDRFESECEEHADGMSRDLRDLGAALDRAPVAEGHPGIGVLRDVRDGRGVVACFAAGGATDVAGVARRLERFASTHDLHDIGGLRYVAARTLDGGATLVVASWTDASFRLDEMFPAGGDAAGADPRSAPRPEGARRLLSARDVRAPYGVFLYESKHASVDAALDAYVEGAKKVGFVDGALDGAIPRADATRALARAGVDVIVSAQPLDDGGALVSIVEMPGAPPLSPSASSPPGRR